MSLHIALIGYGRMGRAIDELSSTYGCDVVERLDINNNVEGAGIDDARFASVDVAIDFSIAAALATNLPKLAKLGVNLVVGTTGWNADEGAIKQVVKDTGIGMVHAANFSIGVNVFQAIVERAATLFEGYDDVGAWIHEGHHAAKVDAPSGTALALEATMREAGYMHGIDVSSTRAGTMPGTHTVGFDGPFETITLTHTTRDRATFARGALEAARWIKGKRGWFTMRDVLGLK